MNNQKREVQCPHCREFRTVTKKNKYDNMSMKVCAACVPKAYPPSIVRRDASR